MRALLDINVLLALFDTNHIHHDRARDWLTQNIEHGWASCALTQNGFVRIISQPRYPNATSVPDAIRRLAQATATPHHTYWDCGVSFLDPDLVDSRHVLGSRQITDVYLLALATRHSGRLVTFDQGIPRVAVRNAGPENLLAL